VLLRAVLGPLLANVLALLVTAVGNTAANRRITFGVHGRRYAARHQVQGLIVLGIGLGVTSGALALLGQLAPTAGRPVEVAVLVVANALATVARFLLFRNWVFRAAAPDRHFATS
jgi:putative flippase GtrA